MHYKNAFPRDDHAGFQALTKHQQKPKTRKKTQKLVNILFRVCSRLCPQQLADVQKQDIFQLLYHWILGAPYFQTNRETTGDFKVHRVLEDTPSPTTLGHCSDVGRMGLKMGECTPFISVHVDCDKWTYFSIELYDSCSLLTHTFPGQKTYHFELVKLLNLLDPWDFERRFSTGILGCRNCILDPKFHSSSATGCRISGFLMVKAMGIFTSHDWEWFSRTICKNGWRRWDGWWLFCQH